jgi:hypothetical protein
MPLYHPPRYANERLTLNRAGDVVLQLKSPYHDGTTHVVMSPLELMQPLAALVPRPRLHLIRFRGVLAPNAKLGSEIIPSSGRQSRFSRQSPCAWLSQRAGQHAQRCRGFHPVPPKNRASCPSCSR